MMLKTKKEIFSALTFVTVAAIHAAYSIYALGETSCVAVNGATTLQIYLEQQDYLLTLSYALALSFTVYAFLKISESRTCGITGIAGGMTLTGFIYAAGCFLLGCCGSPMLTVYITLFGASSLGLRKPLVFSLTLLSVSAGFIWLHRKTRMRTECCSENRTC
jgi:hypothetical protein